MKTKKNDKQFIIYVTYVHEHVCEKDIQHFERFSIINHNPEINCTCSFGLDLNSKEISMMFS